MWSFHTIDQKLTTLVAKLIQCDSAANSLAGYWRCSASSRFLIQGQRPSFLKIKATGYAAYWLLSA